MSGLWQWVPGESVGPLVFGERADLYIQDYGLRKRETDCSIADWETYEFPGFQTWIVVEKGLIIEVHCVDEVEFRDRDLLGMQSSDVRGLLGKESNKEENVGLGYALYYDELGLTLFIMDDVVSVAVCGQILADEDYDGTPFLPMTHA